MTSSPTASAEDFRPGTFLLLMLTLNSGKTMDLHCDARWLHSFMLPTSEEVNTLGLQIVSQQLKYLEYFNSLT
jgi:hypothetical protein